MRRSHISKGDAVARQRVHFRWVGGPSKRLIRMGWRPILFFVVLAALTAILGILREDAVRKMAPAISLPSRDGRR